MNCNFKKKALFYTFLMCCLSASAQTPKTDSTEHKNEALNLISASYAGNGAAPKINLKTYKFKALIGKQEFDFYLFNSVPSVIPKLKKEDATESQASESSKRYLSNDILQQVGGLLNLSLAKVGYFGYGEPALKYVKGVQIDFRLGAKLLEAPFVEKTDFFPVMQSYLDLRYLIPLIDPAVDKTKSYRERMVGNLSFRFVGAAQQFFVNEKRDDPYSRFFAQNLTVGSGANAITKTIQPKTLLFSGNFEAFFYLTNKVYISTGYFFSNDKLIDNYPFFSISYGSK